MFASVVGAARGGFAQTPAAESYLAKWATASAASSEPDLDQYSDRYGDDYPESVLKYVAAFFGPVDAKGLETAFRWSVMEVGETEVRLRATPRTHDSLATIAPTSVASSADIAVPTQKAAVTERPGEMLAFDVVFDTRFPSPRMVTWLGPNGDAPREAVERLYAIEAPLGPMRGKKSSDCFADVQTGRVQLASATTSSSELNAGVDPAVLEILSRWEQAAMQLKSVEINFKRFDRDNVFEIETRGVGKFIYVAPNRGMYQLKGAPVVERAEGPSAASGGKFAVAAAKPQLYWWSGENVTIVDQRDRTYDTLPIPKRLSDTIQTVGSWDVIWQVLAGPQKALPAVVDLKAEKMLNRFEWSVRENSEIQIHLSGIPRTTQDRRHIKMLSVMLDPKTYRTTATLLLDPSGQRETIHSFEYVKTNDSALTNIDSWKPDLKDLSPVGPPPLAPAVEELPGTPPAQ